MRCGSTSCLRGMRSLSMSVWRVWAPWAVSLVSWQKPLRTTRCTTPLKFITLTRPWRPNHRQLKPSSPKVSISLSGRWNRSDRSGPLCVRTSESWRVSAYKGRAGVPSFRTWSPAARTSTWVFDLSSMCTSDVVLGFIAGFLSAAAHFMFYAINLYSLTELYYYLYLSGFDSTF